MDSMLDLVEGMPSGLDLELKEGHSDIIDEEEPVPQAPRLIKRKKRTRRRRHTLNPNDIININNISRASDLVKLIKARRGVQHIDNPIDLHVLSEILSDKKKILHDMPIEQLGNPTGVKTLNKYIERKPVGGEAFTIIRKGAPAAVRATIKYNDLIKYWKLDKKHSTIVQGDKVKWIYMKKNPYNIEALAYLDFDMPDKIRDFLTEIDVYALLS